MGEHAAIVALTANLDAAGDDCAVLPLDDACDQVLTSDPLIQHVHFTVEAAPEQIAHKAVGRVLSDIAAMGAEPQYLLVNVVAPPEQDFRTLETIYAELSRSSSHRAGNLLDLYGVEVVGGDLAQGPVLELHVFGTGRVPKGTALLRSGAQPGDHIYVTGPLGCAQQTGRQFAFEPRMEWGRRLRESGAVTAMMDLSDGLATDLRHMLKASGVGAALESVRIPKVGTLEQALYDGEDFELLFTSPEEFDFQSIGKITGHADTLLLDGEVMDVKAFEHFKSR